MMHLVEVRVEFDDEREAEIIEFEAYGSNMAEALAWELHPDADRVTVVGVVA